VVVGLLLPDPSGSLADGAEAPAGNITRTTA